MSLRSMFAVLVCASAALFSQGAAAQNPAPNSGGLEGKFEIRQRDGKSRVPQGTKIWILYGPSTGCVVLGHVRGPIDCHIELPADRFLDAEHACELKSSKPMQKIMDELSQLRSTGTDVEEQRREGLSAELNAYYTRCGDVGVAKTMEWAQKHPRDNWQTRVVTADESGHWSALGLHSGHYIVIIRASTGSVDAYSLDTNPPLVEPGQMRTVLQLNPLLSDRATSLTFD